MKAPKDLSKYTDSSVAAAQLLNLVIDRILMLKPGWKIKWSCSISMWNDTPPAGMTIIPRQGTYSSVGDGEQATHARPTPESREEK